MRRYEIRISFEAEGAGRNDVIHRAELLFGDLPLQNLRIDAAVLPMTQTEFHDQELAKHEIEHDLDQGVSLTELLGDVGRVRHPWEDGLWLFDEDHPLHDYERIAKQEWEGDHDPKHLERFNRLQLEAGDGSEGDDED